MAWAGSMHTRLASAEMPHDIKSCQEMQKEHDELLDDIKAKKDRFVKQFVPLNVRYMHCT
jgi:hypothetical protein